MPIHEQPSLQEWLQAEPFTLAMSSGFFGFYAHAGVLSALSERDLAPVATRGSSAGALVTALWAAGVEPEQISQDLSELRREDFWDPGFGAGLIKGKKFDEKLRNIVPITEIGECAVPVRISVFDILHRETEVIANGDIVLAVRASCAFPGLFRPVRINDRHKLDGGIKDHDGYFGAPLNERILHHKLPSGRSSKRQIQTGTKRSNIRTIEIGSLPRITPFTLGNGMVAYELARTGTIELLDKAVEA